MESARLAPEPQRDEHDPTGTVVAAPGGAGLRTSMCLAVAAIAVLNLADLVSTRVLLGHPGAIEGNPLARLLLSSGRLEIVKAATLLVLIFRVPRRRPSVAFHAVLWFVAGVYALTVISNLLVWRQYG